ncbi:MAG: glycoside hydrolase family 3 N-terminal domain-containing protein, partial [Ruminococcus sp.]
NVNMAPVCDVTSNKNSFMYSRSFSSDTDKVCEFVKRVVKISSDKKLGTVLKHFPGYGDNEDTHTGIAYDNRQLSQLEENDFKPFVAGIENGADCILVSHNILTKIDNEYPASLSKKVHDIIRENLGFDGVIMTDDLSMEAITDYTGADTAAVSAVKGGNDVLCCTDVDVQYPAVLEAVNKGEISESQIDESVIRILKWKQSLGLI